MALSVLIVDDSLPMRSVIKKTFRAAGYGNAQFFEADHGKTALKVMDGEWIDIVITDFNMPEMNGLELIDAMKENELFSGIPVVVVTTEGSREKTQAFLDRGAAGFIRKPFPAETLRDVLVQVLGESDDEEEIDGAGDDFDF